MKPPLAAALLAFALAACQSSGNPGPDGASPDLAVVQDLLPPPGPDSPPSPDMPTSPDLPMSPDLPLPDSGTPQDLTDPKCGYATCDLVFYPLPQVVLVEKRTGRRICDGAASVEIAYGGVKRTLTDPRGGCTYSSFNSLIPLCTPYTISVKHPAYLPVTVNAPGIETIPGTCKYKFELQLVELQ